MSPRTTGACWISVRPPKTSSWCRTGSYANPASWRGEGPELLVARRSQVSCGRVPGTKARRQGIRYTKLEVSKTEYVFIHNSEANSVSIIVATYTDSYLTIFRPLFAEDVFSKLYPTTINIYMQSRPPDDTPTQIHIVYPLCGKYGSGEKSTCIFLLCDLNIH